MADENTAEDSSSERIPLVNRREGDWKLYNIIILGICFMLIFSAFQTTSMAAVSRLIIKNKLF